MQTWAIALLFAFLSCSKALTQVSATFYLEKDVIKPGQTAIVHFKVTNLGASPYLLDTTGLPNQPSCSGYLFKVLRQPSSTANPNGPLASTCVINGQFHHVSIAPGVTYVQDLDLSLYLDLRVRGEYTIEVAHRAVPWSGGTHDLANAKAELSFRVE
ncbi:hypothetical protein [Terriglobus albidus]|uniref:hypothetical protein n=1 Tax=Terriglobus albidus TaxID=1592106 RepID=UPI0021E0F3B9|nr:hypothetical protein [Terriglobus albidus]